ncbi:hypothetical protein F4604DRAFT_1684977 [Suillus subluteus]|nr:hypothetical protein F4604DRAFT_1684977 [Suillus subluteus]
MTIDINTTAGYSSSLTSLRAHNSDATPLYGLSSWLVNASGAHAMNESPAAWRAICSLTLAARTTLTEPDDTGLYRIYATCPTFIPADGTTLNTVTDAPTLDSGLPAQKQSTLLAGLPPADVGVVKEIVGTAIESLPSNSAREEKRRGYDLRPKIFRPTEGPSPRMSNAICDTNGTPDARCRWGTLMRDTNEEHQCEMRSPMPREWQVWFAEARLPVVVQISQGLGLTKVTPTMVAGESSSETQGIRVNM